MRSESVARQFLWTIKGQDIINLSLSHQVRFKTASTKSSDDHGDNDDNDDDDDDNINNDLMMMMLIIIIIITTLQCNGFALSSPRESFVDARKAAAPA